MYVVDQRARAQRIWTGEVNACDEDTFGSVAGEILRRGWVMPLHSWAAKGVNERTLYCPSTSDPLRTTNLRDNSCYEWQWGFGDL